MTPADSFIAHSRRSSDLSKHSAEVFAEAEDHPVTVTRRDGESLVLMSQRAADERNRLLTFAARLLSVALEDAGTLTDRMTKTFPWMLALSAEDRGSCTWDLIESAQASMATNRPHLAIAELTSWKETATAIAAGPGNTDLERLNDDDPDTLVDRP